MPPSVSWPYGVCNHDNGVLHGLYPEYAASLRHARPGALPPRRRTHDSGPHHEFRCIDHPSRRTLDSVRFLLISIVVHFFLAIQLLEVPRLTSSRGRVQEARLVLYVLVTAPAPHAPRVSHRPVVIPLRLCPEHERKLLQHIWLGMLGYLLYCTSRELTL